MNAENLSNFGAFQIFRAGKPNCMGLYKYSQVKKTSQALSAKDIEAVYGTCYVAHLACTPGCKPWEADSNTILALLVWELGPRSQGTLGFSEDTSYGLTRLWQVNLFLPSESA